MVLRQHRSQTVVICIVLLTAIFSSDAKRPKRPLLRVREQERVPDSYFVHLRNSVKVEKAQKLVRELQLRSSEGGNFKAYVTSIITRAGYGFSARLSQEALDYVSDFACIIEMLGCYFYGYHANVWC